MQKIKIAIDIDLCITNDLGERWLDHLYCYWLNYHTPEQARQLAQDYAKGEVEYNLTKYFNIPDYIDEMSFWKQGELYDEEVLQEGCYEVIKNLWQAGFEIAFMSHTTFEHIHSKYKFLQRNFDFLYENDDLHFIATKSKFCTDGAFDIIIDDRNEHLQYATKALRLKMKTPYKQNFILDKEHVVCENWFSIEEEICKHLEEI